MRVSQLLTVLTLAVGVTCRDYKRINRPQNPLKKPELREEHGDTNKYIVEFQPVSMMSGQVE